MNLVCEENHCIFVNYLLKRLYWNSKFGEIRQVTYIEGFKSLGVHPLGVIDLIAVVVVIVIVVVFVHDLRAARAQILSARTQFGLHGVVAS